MPKNNNLTLDDFVKYGGSEFSDEETKQDFLKSQEENKNIGAPLAKGSFASGEYKDRLVRGSTTSLGESFDFENFQAYQQSVSEKWQRGVTKLGGKIGLYTIGGLGSLVYSLPSAILSGSLHKFYDNEFVKFLDKQEGKLDENFRNYYRTAERDYNVFKSMGTANFWANDFLGGMAFVVGAVTTEAIASAITAATFGAGAGIQATATARLLNKATKLLNKATKSTKAGEVGLKSLSNINRFTNGLRDSAKISRQLISGSGYESSVEAYHFVEEAKAGFLKDFEERNGRQPNQQELAEQMDKIYQSGNALFAGNMALVGGTNMVTLPKTFGIKLTNVPKGGVINKLISGADDSVIGSARNVTRAGAGSKWELAYDSWSKAKKIGFGAKEILKRPFYEGIVEEGGQGFMSRAALDYTAKGYSSDGAANAYTLWDAMGTAFGQTYADGSNNEFWKEVAIGMILGGMGSPSMSKGIWQGSAIQSYRDSLKGIEKARQFVNDMNEGDVAPRLKASIKASVGIYEDTKEMEKALEEGDMLRAKNAENSLLFRSISARYKAGNAQTYKEDMKESINNMSDEEFSEMFGYSDYTSEQIAKRKAETLKAFEDKVDSVVDAIKIAEGIVGSRDLKGEEYTLGSEEVIEALAYSIESSRNADMREAEMAKEYSEIIKESVDKIIEASRLPANINLSKTWIKKYETEKELKEKWIKEREKLDTTSEDKAVQKRLDYVNEKIAEHEQKLARRIEEKHALEVSRNEGYNYNIDTLTTALEAMTDIYKKNKEIIDVKPETIEQIRNLHGDLQRVAAQRNELVQEIQALMSREGREAFGDDVREIEKDSFKITKDALIGRYKNSILQTLVLEGNLELAEAIVEADEVKAQALEEISNIQDTDNKDINNLKQQAEDAEKDYMEGPKTGENTKTLRNRLNGIVKALKELTNEEVSDKNLEAINQMLTILNSRVESLSQTLEVLKEVVKQGEEKVLNSVNGLVRVIIDKKREEEVTEHIKNRDKKFMYQFLTIKKEPYENASKGPVSPRNSAGIEMEGPISIKRGDGEAMGYYLYDGDFKIGGITRPDRFLYEGQPLDITNDEHIKALGITDLQSFRAYYLMSKEIFDKVDKGETITGKELGKVIKFRYNFKNFDKVSNNEVRPLVKDLFKNNPSYHYTVGKHTGILVRGREEYFIYDGTSELKNVTNEVGEIASSISTETISKIRSQYIAIVPGIHGKPQPLGLDYPRALQYETEDLEKEILDAMNTLNNLSKEELDKRRATNNLVYEPLEMFITLYRPDSKTSNMHIDARVQRTYNKNTGEYSVPYLMLKTSSTAESRNVEYVDRILIERDGKLQVSMFEKPSDKKPTRYEFSKGMLLKAYNQRIRGMKNGVLGELVTNDAGDVIVEAVNIKKRMQVEDIGELEFAALLPGEKEKYYLTPNKEIFDNEELNNKVTEIAAMSQKSQKAVNKTYDATQDSKVLKDLQNGTATLEKYPFGTIIMTPQEGAKVVISERYHPITKKYIPDAYTIDEVQKQIELRLSYGRDPFSDYTSEGRLGKRLIKGFDFDTAHKMGYTVDEQGVVSLEGEPVTRLGQQVKPIPNPAPYLRGPKVENTQTAEANNPAPTVQEAVETAENAAEEVSTPKKPEEAPDTNTLFALLNKKREEKEEDKKDDDIVFSEIASDSFPIRSLREAEKILSKILPMKTDSNPDGIFSIQDIARLKQALSTNGVTFGAFYQSVIYLDQNRATVDTAYHEAFHAVFRVLTSSSERSSLLRQAAKEYGTPTQAQLNNLKAQHPSYANKTTKELTELYYEEEMAKAFAKKATSQPKTWLGKIFQKIQNWIDSLLNVSKSDITVYFDNILQGQYRNSNTIREEEEEPAFSFFKIPPRPTSEYVSVPPRTSLTEAETNRIVSRVASILMMKRRGGRNMEDDISDAIERVAAFYDISNWENTLDAIGNQAKKNNTIAQLVDIGNALKGRDNIKVIKKHVSNLIKVVDAELYDEQEDADTPESYNDRYIGENSGYKTLSQQIKAFLLTVSYNGDEFNLGLSQEWLDKNRTNVPINVYRSYFNMQKALVETKPINMLKKLRYLANTDLEMQAIYDGLVAKIKREAGINKPIEDYTLKELEKSNFFNSFVANFDRSRLDIKDVLYDVSTGRFKIISANQKDAGRTQLTEWYEKYSNITSRKSNYQIADALLALRNKYYAPDGDIGTYITNLEKNLEYIKTGLLDNLGMSLSTDYLRWSWVHDNLEDIKKHQAYLDSLEEVSPVEDRVRELLEFHDAFNTGINSLDEKIAYKGKIGSKTKNQDAPKIGTIFQLIPSSNILTSTIINNRSPYGVNEVDVDDERNKTGVGGARTRLFNIAAANAVFDPTVRPTSYQNIEGKNIWDVVHRSFYMDVYSLFKTSEFKRYAENINESTWEDLRDILKDNGMVYPDHIVKLYHGSIRNNPLITSVPIEELFSSRMVLESIGGIKETELNSDGKIIAKEFKDGKTWKHMDYKSKLIANMAYYASQAKGDTDTAFTRYNWNVNEGKSTTLLARLPKFETVVGGELSNTALRHLTKMFIGEYEKIQFEVRNIYNVEKGTINRMDGYNFNRETGATSFEDDPSLRAFKFNTFAWLEDINEPLYTELLASAREGKVMSEDELLTKLSDSFQIHFKTLAQEMVELLQGEDFRMVLTMEDSEGNEELIAKGIPEYFVNDGRIDMEKILELISNDYINTVSFNNLMDIDSFLNKKDFTDFVKRNAGKIAYGPSLGSGQSRIAIIDNKPNWLNEEVDENDAQSYSTESWEYNVYKKYTGKIPNDSVKEILLRKRKGYKLSELDIKVLKYHKAMDQSKKLVGYDHMTYLKTSVATIQRSNVSYVDSSNRKGLDILYDKLFALEETGGSVEEIMAIKAKINSIWKPLPNKKKLHNLLNKMEAKEVGLVSFESAIKSAASNVSTVNEDGSVSLDPVIINNKFIREQVNTDGFKSRIVHGTQLMQLIWSEQNNDTKVTIRGRKFTVGQIKEHYKKLISERINNGRINLENTIFEIAPNGKLGKAQYKELYKSFKRSVEESNPNPYLQELFATDINGNPEYDPNFTGVSAKFFQMFMAYASADVMKHKTKGAKYTLMSHFGHKILEDKDGNIIKWTDLRNEDGTINKKVWDKLPKDKDGEVLEGRELRYENGISEAIISSNIAKLYNLKPGQEIPPSVAKQIGFRIPTQDKHSMVRLKVVDILPAETMNTIIVHPEVIRLSGADFDIDSLYARMLETFDGTEFGSYLEPSKSTSEQIINAVKEIRASSAMTKKLKSFLEDTKFKGKMQIYRELREADTEDKFSEEMLEKLTDKKSRLQYEETRAAFFAKEKLYLDVKDLQNKNPDLYHKIVNNINLYKAGKMEGIESLTTEETNNRLFDIEHELMFNEGNSEIAQTPVSMDSIDQILEQWKDQGLDYTISSKRSHDILSKLKAIQANDAGNGGIGPAALANIAAQLLADTKAKLKNSVLGRKNFVLTTAKDNRVNDLISTVISAMTDNTKFLYSSQLNLNVNTVSFATTMFNLGFDSEFVYSLMRNPIFSSYSSILERISSPLTPESQKRILRSKLGKPEKAIKLLMDSIGFEGGELDKVKIELTEENLIEALKFEKGLESKLSGASEYYAIQYQIARDTILPLKNINEEMRTFTRILSLIKGFQSKPTRINSLFDDVSDLGFNVSYDKNNVTISKQKNPDTQINWTTTMLKTPYVEENIKTAAKIKAFLGEYLLSFSKVGESIINSAKVNANKNRFDNDEKMMSMIRDFSSYIMIKKYKVNKSRSYTPAELFDRSIIDKHRELLKEVDDPKSPLYKNAFLLALSSNVKKRGGARLFELIMNTRSLRSKDITASLLDAFRVLTAYPEYKAFAGDLIKHLILKDALVYRNNSYLSSIDPSILKEVIDPLTELTESFNSQDNEQIKKLLKSGVETLKSEFSELYLLDSLNENERRQAHFRTLVQLRNDAANVIGEKVGNTFDENNSIVDYDDGKFNPVKIEQKKAYDTPTKISFSLRTGVNQKAFVKKENESKDDFKKRVIAENEYIKKLQERLTNFGIINKSFIPTGKDGFARALAFPLGMNVSYVGNRKTDNGSRIIETTYYRLKRINRNPFKNEWEDPSVLEGHSLVAAFDAEYEPIEGSNYGLFSTMAYDVADLSEAYPLIKKEVEKEGRSNNQQSQEMSKDEMTDFIENLQELQKQETQRLVEEYEKTHGNVDEKVGEWIKNNEKDAGRVNLLPDPQDDPC